MKIFATKLASRMSAYGTLLTSGSLLFALLPATFLHPIALPSLSPVKTENIAALNMPAPVSLIDAFFGANTPDKVSAPIIEKQMSFVSSRNAFPASLSVIEKHEVEIRAAADKAGVPQDVALGVALLENGGSETSVSRAGALGVFQLMPGTARNLGLTVNKKVDERKNVHKNIDAGVSYLKANYERFGDWGLATWAYHAGEGNVGKALALYKKAGGTGIPTIHQLLSSNAVKKFAAKLSDDSDGYPYKVIATATLLRQSKQGLVADNEN